MKVLIIRNRGENQKLSIRNQDILSQLTPSPFARNE